MVMDQYISSCSGTMSRIKFNNQAFPVSPDPNMIDYLRVSDRFLDRNNVDNMPVSSQFSFDAPGHSSEGEYPEDFDFSDVVLKYINIFSWKRMWKTKPACFKSLQLFKLQKNHSMSPDDKFSGELKSYCGSGDMELCVRIGILIPTAMELTGIMLLVILSHNLFLSHLIVHQVATTPSLMARWILLGKGQKEGHTSMVVKVEKNINSEESSDLSRGKKNPYHESMGLQDERSSKQSATYSESTVTPEMFDKVLLCSGGRNESALRKELSEVSKLTPQSAYLKGSTGGKTRGKKQGGKRNVVDLRTLLTLCAQAVAADDRRTANEFLKQIRQHATPTGDGMQRLAHYFADGLVARMAGSGTQIYTSVINMPTSAADVLKAYHIYLATCPFRKISNFFAIKTIMNLSAKVTRLHIIDFGILYGFQWPCFLQRLSSRPGGPPKLRITGIDLPCPGFRPSERVEETGRHLARYAETFKVPFEFNAIAQKWETITLEDLKINTDELLVVNCLYRFRNLLDETVMVNSPRNIVLNLIRKMNPAVFVLGIVNGSYNAPFFITRFREALFHYSSLFDMLEAIIPREIHERMLLERIVFGREAMNVIACEAAERIERPETYKQWQARNMRAGFEQLPLDKEIMKMARNRVESSYHKDFVIDEDGHWMLQGWKGRIVYALSSWRPAY
ncbi:UNVERIFIED_CONTAM: Scarecrow-like protein 14 [Sesamum calycinum]|uniref:Scarecrow-like protein 14 n=1 Tax=Sesamum calycinum TaxID=2727403 RepID=A0AAW2LRK0_9LAMI